MRRTLTAAILLTSTMAQAAEYGTPLTSVALASRWTGFYAGGNLGAAFGGDSVSYTAPAYYGTTPLSSSSSSKVGAAGGFQAGYSHQLGSVVFGLEADVSVSDAKSSETFNTVSVNSSTSSYSSGGIIYTTTSVNTFQSAQTPSTNVNWFGTLRARVGYALTPDVVIFGTGGISVGGVQAGLSATNFSSYSSTTCGGGTCTTSSSTSGPGYGSTSGHGTAVGWAVGGGIDYGLTQNISLRGEYMYVDFGEVSLNDGYSLGPTYSIAPTFSVARAAANWRF